jgi:hypothetical protein
LGHTSSDRKEAKEQTMSKIETVKTALDQDKRPLHDDELEAVYGGTLTSNIQKKLNDTVRSTARLKQEPRDNIGGLGAGLSPYAETALGEGWARS